jgi:predicted sugar kinase
MVQYRYKAEGLIVDGGLAVAIKESNFPLIGATWIPGEGIVWHISDEAMEKRRRRGYDLIVTEVKTSETDQLLEFLELRRKFKDFDFRWARHIREKYPKGYPPPTDT